MSIMVSGNRTAKELVNCMRDSAKCEKVAKDDVDDDETLYSMCYANNKFKDNLRSKEYICRSMNTVAIAIMIINHDHKTFQKEQKYVCHCNVNFPPFKVPTDKNGTPVGYGYGKNRGESCKRN